MIRTSLIASLAILFSSLTAASSAATIEIGFQFLDLKYDGANLVDSGDALLGTADTLDAVTFRVDGSAVGSITTDIYADVDIPVVIPSTASPGSSISTSSAGTFDVLFNGDFLSLQVDEVTVTFIDAVTAQFIFGAGPASEILGQSLPFGLEIGEPVQISFSAQLDTGDESEFSASGSGEIEGLLIPEPSALVLTMLAVVAGRGRRLRPRR